MSRLLTVFSEKNNVLGLVASGGASQIYGGEKGSAIATINGRGVQLISENCNMVNLVPEIKQSIFKGRVGLAFNSSRDDNWQLLQLTIGKEEVIVAVDSGREAFVQIQQILESSRKLEIAFKHCLLKVEMPFSMVAIKKHSMLAGRNSGRIPLTYGKINSEIDGYYFASQSNVLGSYGHYLGSVLPGEMVYVNYCGPWRQMVKPQADKIRCIHGVTYLDRQDNRAGERSICAIRQEWGQAMFMQTKDIFSDDIEEFLVMPVPNGGLHYFLGYIKNCNCPNNPAGIIKSYPCNLKMSDEERIKVTYTLACPDELVDKKVILIDDMARKGQRLKVIAQKCRNAGAVEVHGVVAAVTYNSCLFGNDEYVFPGVAQKRDAESLGLDSFHCLDPKIMKAIVETPDRPYCANCIFPSP